MTVRSVLVTSDTHVVDGAHLPAALLVLAERADHVLHCGDLTSPDVLDVLAALAPVDAVAGNCDGLDVTARAPMSRVVELAGVRIGMVHDAGPAADRAARLRAWFPDCAVAVHGHTHEPQIDRSQDGLLVLNPGSPVQRRRAPFHSAIWLRLEPGRVVGAELLDLDGR